MRNAAIYGIHRNPLLSKQFLILMLFILQFVDLKSEIILAKYPSNVTVEKTLPIGESLTLKPSSEVNWNSASGPCTITNIESQLSDATGVSISKSGSSYTISGLRTGVYELDFIISYNMQFTALTTLFGTVTVKYVISVIDVESITNIPSKLSLTIGESHTFDPKIYPEGITAILEWESDDPSVVTIDGNGKAFGKSCGTATIFCRAKNGVTAQCVVTINPIYVESISLGLSECELLIDERIQFNASVLPENATNKNITWSSDNPSVAYINSNGLVIGQSLGYCEVTAASTDGSNKSATCLIHVVAKATEYQITYMVEDTIYSQVMVARGSEIPRIESPLKKGHSFTKWNGLPEIMPANDITVYAEFIANKHSLKYLSDCKVFATQEIEYGTTPTLDSIPAKENFIFSHWEGLPQIMPDNDVSVTALFKRPEPTGGFSETPGVYEQYSGMGGDSICWIISTNMESIDKSDRGNLSFFGKKDMYNYIDTIPYWKNISCITSIAINEGISSIGNNCFSQFQALKSISIPKSVRNIGNCAFSSCPNLESISVRWDCADSIPSLNENVFGDINFNNISLLVPYQTASLYKNADIWNRFNIMEQKQILNYGMCGDNLNYVIYGDGEMIISGYGETYNWESREQRPYHAVKDSIKTVIIESGATVIGSYAFNQCRNLKDVVLPKSVTEISYAAFERSGIENLDFLNNVTEIGVYAFVLCENLTHIEIPGTIKTISDYAFEFCPNLQSVIISEGVENILWSAFYGCENLNTITIPESLKIMNHMAFADCANLNVINYNAIDCKIRETAFHKSHAITTVNFGENVHYIPSYFLHDNQSITSITLPKNAKTIGSYAFQNCTALTTIDIPESINTIESNCFEGCKNLSSVIVSWSDSNTLPHLYESVFLGLDLSNINLYVPIGSKPIYESANVWKEFNLIEGKPISNINNIISTSNITEVCRYSINGDILTKPQQGVNIIHMSDGSFRKVIVK